MCGDNRPAGAGTSLGAPHHGHFPLGLQLRLGAPSFPRGPGFSSISSLLPPPHTPCGLEQPCYNITMCCGVGMAKLSCPQRGGALQAALGQTSGLEAPRGAGEPQPDLPQAASGVPIGTTVSQHGHGYSMRTRTHWYPLHPTPFPLPPRHPALCSRNIPYPGRWGGRGRMLETLPFSRAEPGKVLAEERPILPSQNWRARVALARLLRSEHTSSPRTHQLPGRAWSLPGWSHPSHTLGHV